MGQLSEAEGRSAVSLARQAVECAVRRERIIRGKLPPAFSEVRGVFVTLSKEGELRGCIGLPYPIAPLADAIAEAGASAALRDPRFMPVGQSELSRLQVEVTVLTLPVPIPGPAESRAAHVEIGRHGLIVRGRGTSGLLLPQVATEYGWSVEDFLDHTCRKAGLSGGCWRSPEIEVSTFEGQIFRE
ncbi:MAG: TIGR00296 family protein [Methanospirillum sp.]|nr:TIGR00296 family protein [Methanospirillum sp.]